MFLYYVKSADRDDLGRHVKARHATEAFGLWVEHHGPALALASMVATTERVDIGVELDGTPEVITPSDPIVDIV